MEMLLEPGIKVDKLMRGNDWVKKQSKVVSCFPLTQSVYTGASMCVCVSHLQISAYLQVF